MVELKLVHLNDTNEEYDADIVKRPTLMETLSNMRYESTIYKRHEARLAKSYALKDDPRPAILRVLSGLPGFRILVKPYDGNNNDNNSLPPLAKQQHQKEQLSTKLGEYSEQTIYAIQDDKPSPSLSSRSTFDANSSYYRLAPGVVIQTVVVTGTAGGVAEFLFGMTRLMNTSNSATFSKSSSFNPFQVATQGGKTKKFHGPLFFLSLSPSQNDLAVNILKPKDSNHRSYLLPKQAKSSFERTMNMTMAASCTTSVLFGTKLLLEQQQQHTLPGWLSSAMAGAVTGGFTLMVSHWNHPPSLSISKSIPLSYMGQHVLAATLYFTTYEQVMGKTINYNNKEQQVEETEWKRVALAGALAGCVQATVSSISTTTMSSSHSVLLARWIPAMVRAAPSHALIFSAYEWIKKQQPQPQHSTNLMTTTTTTTHPSS